MSAKGFGGRLEQARLDQAARRRKTFTKVEVGKRLGVTSTTVGRWETGEKEPSLATIKRLAALFEIDPCWLAFGLDDAEGQGAVKLNPRPRTRDRSRDEKGDKHA